MNRDELFFALHETTHALRFVQSAAKRLLDVHHREPGAKITTSMAYVSNRLLDAATALSDAEVEINVLIRNGKAD